MNIRSIIILLLMVMTSCGSASTKIDDHDIDDEENYVLEEWDRHQFFDDLESTTLDSLRNVIESSDSIVGYNWNGNDGNPANVSHHIVDAYGAFSSRIGREITLNKSQIRVLKAILSDPESFDKENAMCFIPHIAFVYYKESKIVGQSNVCFLCAGVRSIPKSTTALSYRGGQALKSFCEELGLEIIDQDSQTSK